MKIHTTNYINTFIEIAEDCPVDKSEIPSARGADKTIAELQYEILINNPYKFSSDDVLFHIFAIRNVLSKSDKKAREDFFSKGQACFRASPLTKRYGFGVHSDAEGKMAIYSCESIEYKKFINDINLKKVKAMRTSKK